MAGKNFNSHCKLGYELDGKKINFLTICQFSKFQVFVDTNGRFQCSLVSGNLHSETKDSPVLIRLLAMCKGELSAVID